MKPELPVTTLLALVACLACGASEWPDLPDRNGRFEVPAQDAPRMVRVYLSYPDGDLASVGHETGLMLTLHNWGGTAARGTADPATLARTFNLVVLAVDYLHSGPYDSGTSPPYDFGYVQANDALRALWSVYDALQRQGIPFDAGRIYATGGSGGGNVSLMCNKLAPRTFAAIIDMCGMARLTDDIAFGLEGGSRLNAGYSRDAAAEHYLSPDAQAIRFVGYPAHLQEMKRLGNGAKIVVVHGTTDDVCPFADAEEMVANMKAADLDVLPVFVTKAMLDGKTFTSTGHPLGDRTAIAVAYGRRFLDPASGEFRRLDGPNDFERRETVRYTTPNGAFELDYTAGYPVFRFQAE